MLVVVRFDRFILYKQFKYDDYFDVSSRRR